MKLNNYISPVVYGVASTGLLFLTVKNYFRELCFQFQRSKLSISSDANPTIANHRFKHSSKLYATIYLTLGLAPILFSLITKNKAHTPKSLKRAVWITAPILILCTEKIENYFLNKVATDMKKDDKTQYLKEIKDIHTISLIFSSGFSGLAGVLSIPIIMLVVLIRSLKR